MKAIFTRTTTYVVLEECELELGNELAMTEVEGIINECNDNAIIIDEGDQKVQNYAIHWDSLYISDS